MTNEMTGHDGLRTTSAEPYYVPIGEEREVFAAYHVGGLPVMLRQDTIVVIHPLTDDLTRIALVFAYNPKGFVEKTGNIWLALNRRLRLELKLFVRHVMTVVVLHPDDVEGYRA